MKPHIHKPTVLLGLGLALCFVLAIMQRAESNAPSDAAAKVVGTPSQVQAPPKIDEINYWRQVKLIFSGQDLHQALMLKPQFRPDVLNRRATVATILNGYTASEKAMDEKWILAHQDAQRVFHAQSSPDITKSGYPIDQFVGFRCGQRLRLSDEDAICYKIFFDFKDAPRDLTPEIYMQFVRALVLAGFTGDSKISMNPGHVRFFYNDIIVHAPTPEQAKIAQDVGFKTFGTLLANYGRGVDLMHGDPGSGRQSALDWHGFLTQASDLSGLTPKAMDFVLH